MTDAMDAETTEDAQVAADVEAAVKAAQAAPPQPPTVGAYSQRELLFVEREREGLLTFTYIRNDGTPQNLEWCAATPCSLSPQPSLLLVHQRR